MEQNLKISLIIPAHNMEKYIKDTLDSIFNQTYKNIEVICILDACTDNTKDIVLQYPQVKLFECNFKRPGMTRNVGLVNCTGDYVWCVDADDKFTQDRSIELAVQKLNELNSQNPDNPVTILRLQRYLSPRGILGFKEIEDTEDQHYQNLRIKYTLWSNIFSKKQVVDAGIRFWYKFYDEEQPFMQDCERLPNFRLEEWINNPPLYFYNENRVGGVCFNRIYQNTSWMAFTCLGKTTFCKKHKNCIDIDDKVFADRNEYGLLADFVANCLTKDYIVFVTASPRLMEEYHKRGMFIRLIMPSPEMKNEIIERAKKRYSDIQYIYSLEQVYDDWYNSMIKYPYITDIIYLKPGQYIEDVFDFKDRNDEQH